MKHLIESPRGAQSAIRAIRLLKLFTAEQPNLRLADLSHRSGLNKTTTHRLLQALLSEGMLERDDESRTYRLGTALMAMERPSAKTSNFGSGPSRSI